MDQPPLANLSKQLIQKAFCPRICITSSDDTVELVQQMGFTSLLDLLAPFGDKIEGTVTIRDSNQLSISFDDFSARFIDNIPKTEIISTGSTGSTSLRPIKQDQLFDIGELEQKLGLLLQQTPDDPNGPYLELLSSLFSNEIVTPFETFGHPVAGIIAISSRNHHPIDTLSSLYKQSHDRNIAGYINRDYLRYYLLIHDEQSDDLEKSIALFEKMKRHFGLHCHMVRVQRSFTNETSQQLTPSIWTKGKRTEDMPRLHLDDIKALKTLCRELVVQSVIPFMERSIATWNEQIASSRRGFTGRFFSASKKYFASSTKATSSILSNTANALGGPSNSFPFTLNSSSPSPSPPPVIDGTNLSSNPVVTAYNSAYGFYGYLAPEAQIRKLADFAFMLRDYRFAYTTYELLKKDFHNDKAWNYLAASLEMASASYLMFNDILPSKVRSDIIDPLLDSAIYSYISRCQLPSYALRCLLISSELMFTSKTPGASSECATKWILKAMNERLVGRLGYAIMMERIASAYGLYNDAVKNRLEGNHEPLSDKTTRKDDIVLPGSKRTRKQAFWQLLAAREFFDADQLKRASYLIALAGPVYNQLSWAQTSVGLFGRLERQLDGILVEEIRKLKMNGVLGGETRETGESKEEEHLDGGEKQVEGEKQEGKEKQESGPGQPQDSNEIEKKKIIETSKEEDGKVKDKTTETNNKSENETVEVKEEKSNLDAENDEQEKIELQDNKMIEMKDNEMLTEIQVDEKISKDKEMIEKAGEDIANLSID